MQRRLYADLRADELAAAPWSAVQKDAFLDGQFALQNQHFATQHPRGDFWLVERDGVVVGRLFLDRSASIWRLIELGLFAEARSGGLGQALVRWIQAWNAEEGRRGIDLHVAITNPRARALYERLGFATIGEAEGMHQRMVWPAPDPQLKTA